ncbi:glycine betaine ABC transporter substrate-binding protein [Pseudonocardia hispaniensis]|uniref:Glycine betaine ABC transporter substrate-binding protein n=1 Tax=Pseudonocardia hispaniensis TaxID=904933 RepID=A0ABW1J2D4_9PSEU
MRARTIRARLLILLTGAALALTACGGGGGGTGSGGGGGSLAAINLSGSTFTVGSKEFTEQLVLGQIALQALAATGATVEDRTGISGTTNVRTALTSEQIDMYWEYTGTGWTVHLKHEASQAPSGSEAVYQAVAAEDLQTNHIVWLSPAPANNTYAIATAQGRGDQLGVRNLSDYARLANENPAEASLCAATEFLTRDDGWPGVEQAYGFTLPKANVAEMDLGIIYTQVPTGQQCKFGEVFATDGRIAANKLEIVSDDKNFFVPYNVAMTVREDVANKNPQLAQVFDPIAAKLTTEVLRGLNEQVDVNGQTAEEVAKQFLSDNGFTS